MRKNSTASSVPHHERAGFPGAALRLIGGAILLFALFLGMRHFRDHLITQTATKRYQERLGKWAPTLRRINAKDQALRHNRLTAEALGRWERELPLLHEPLRLIALETPDCIQLHRVSYISSPDKFPASPLTPWDRSLDIQGAAIHPEAEIILIQYQRTLIDTPAITRLAPNLKLVAFNHPETAPEVNTNPVQQAGFLLSGNNYEQKQSIGP